MAADARICSSISEEVRSYPRSGSGRFAGAQCRKDRAHGGLSLKRIGAFKIL
jgi:hypothetical protein